MLRALLIGVVAGLRSMTPPAVIAAALRRGRLADAPAALAWLGDGRVAAGAAALAAAEIAGDKLPFAPDRTVPAGLAARVVVGAVAAAALAPRGRRAEASTIGAAVAVGAAHLGLAARVAAMRRDGRWRTGLVEDALALALAVAVVESRCGPTRARYATLRADDAPTEQR